VPCGKENEDYPQRRTAKITAEAFLAHERQLRNLYTQEARLRRHVEKDLKALAELQNSRETLAQAETNTQLTQAAEALITAIKNGNGRRFNPSEIGFEFSIAQIEAEAAKIDPKLMAAYIANKPRHLRNAA
jgi:hypothetical protein